MKFNEKELAKLSEGKSEYEGRLNYKKINSNNQYYQSVFKERWFKLIDNFLFYFRINDTGKIAEKQAIGVFVLENVSIQQEDVTECPFAFSLSFLDDPDKKHIFSCMSDASSSTWIFKLRCASYEYLRSQLYILQSKIYSKTGQDPLLMVPRNVGSMKWAPGLPKPQEYSSSQLNINTNGFVSHLETENIHRSKSSTSVNEISNIKDLSFLENSWPMYAGVERSKTSVTVFRSKDNPFQEMESSNNVTTRFYHQSAPSPPPRKKNSPLLPRDKFNANLPIKNTSDLYFDNDHFLHVHSSSSHPPVPPMRRNSPKRQGNSENDNSTANNVDFQVEKTEVNLIEF